MGLDLTKPKSAPTPDDYVYEQFIPDTPMTRRFGHLRGAKIKTVSETVADFYNIVSVAHSGVSMTTCLEPRVWREDALTA